jgi:predicted DCC family thiol-disulfide oxidoreductase YuxK
VEILFYDGHCGLCHRAVQFVLRHDPEGKHFRFAPLQGETFKARVPHERRVSLPDSMVVAASEGTLLLHSDAWIHILRRLGGGWGVIAVLVSIVPRAARDLIYDVVASIRYRIFRRRDDLCPVVAPEVRGRFDP